MRQPMLLLALLVVAVHSLTTTSHSPSDEVALKVADPASKLPVLDEESILGSTRCSSIGESITRFRSLAKWLILNSYFSALPDTAVVTYDDVVSKIKASGIYTDDYTITVRGGFANDFSLDNMGIYFVSLFNWGNVYTMYLGHAATDFIGTSSITDDVFSVMVGQYTTHLNRTYRSEDGTVPLSLHYEECGSLIFHEDRSPPTIVIDTFVWNVEHTKYLGAYATCVYHEGYCTGKNKQYDGFDACMTSMSAVPSLSEKCGSKAPGTGYSQTCMQAVKWSIPWRRDLCFAIGPQFRADGSLNVAPDGLPLCKEASCDAATPLLQAPYIIREPDDDYTAAINSYESNLETEFGVSRDNYFGFPFPAGAPDPSWKL